MEGRLKVSYKQKQIPPRYVELRQQLEPFASDMVFRWSHKGVPHLLVELAKGIVYSLCYFGNHESWRVFYPYGTSNQQKRDFSLVEDMVKFLRRHKSMQGRLKSIQDC